MDKPPKKDKKISLVTLIILKYHRYITIGLVVLILVSSYFWILQPKYQQVRKGGTFNLNTLESEFQKRQDYLLELKTLKSNYEKIKKADVDKLDKILPSKNDIPGLFVQLESLALENNLFLNSISINETPANPRSKEAVSEIKKFTINLSLFTSSDGDYRGLKQFLEEIENNLRLFDVNSVFFDPNSSEYSISLFVYYYNS